MQKSRIIGLDILRIVASLNVVFSHVTSASFGRFKVGSFNWWVIIVNRVFTGWASPVYTMISGYIFLGRSMPIETVLKRSRHQLTVYFFWCFIYSVLNNILLYNRPKLFFDDCFHFYHLWYLAMIAGLYLYIPPLQLIASNQSILLYTIILCFGTQCILPTLGWYSFLSGKLQTLITYWPSLSLWSGYFLCGYYLGHCQISKNFKLALYLSGWIGFASKFCGASIYAFHYGKTIGHYWSSNNPGTVLSCVAVFLFFVNLDIHLSSASEKRISQIARKTFGVFLTHMIYITLLKMYHYIPQYGTILVSIPLITLLVYSVSFLTSLLLYALPYHSVFM